MNIITSVIQLALQPAVISSIVSRVQEEDKGASERQVQQNGVQEEEAFEEPVQGEEPCPGTETGTR